MARGAARADLGPDHPVDHERMAVAPGGQELVHVDEGGEELEGQMEDGLVAVEVDEEGGLRGPPGQAAVAFGHELRVGGFVENGGEGGGGAIEARELPFLVLGREGRVLPDRPAVAREHRVDGPAIAGPEWEARRSRERACARASAPRGRRGKARLRPRGRQPGGPKRRGPDARRAGRAWPRSGGTGGSGTPRRARGSRENRGNPEGSWSRAREADRPAASGSPSLAGAGGGRRRCCARPRSRRERARAPNPARGGSA